MPFREAGRVNVNVSFYTFGERLPRPGQWPRGYHLVLFWFMLFNPRAKTPENYAGILPQRRLPFAVLAPLN